MSFKMALFLLYFLFSPFVLGSDELSSDLEIIENELIGITTVDSSAPEYIANFQKHQAHKRSFLDKAGDKGMASIANLLEKHVNTQPKILSYLKYSDITSNDELFSINHISSLKVAQPNLGTICIPRKRTAIDIYFINGMFNTSDSAIFSLSALKGLKANFQSSILKEEGFEPDINFFLLRNKSEFFFT